ncbi:MAG: Tol-Pal system beta propeller repeat protein TolB [bacterium]
MVYSLIYLWLQKNWRITLRYSTCLGLVLCFLFMDTAPGEGKVYLDTITNPEIAPFPIAVADFTTPRRMGGEIAQNVQRTLVNDLKISGLFRVIEPKEFPDKAQTRSSLLDLSDFDVWQGSGVDALVTGSFWVSGDTLLGSFRLYDLVGKKFIKGIRYEGKKELWRTIAHKVANEVVLQITGEKGVFDTQIAFVAKATGNKEICLIDFDGENFRQVTRNKSINILPRWTPDGKKILYTSYMKRNPDLYAIDLASGKNYRISYRNGVNACPTWLSDSEGEKMILMLKQDDRSHLFLTKVGDKRAVPITSGSDNYVSPSWSPDGKQVAFVSDRSGTPQIYIMDITGKNMKRLSYQGGYNVAPAWSPKGDWIAFCSRQNGFFEIFLSTPDGEKVRQITHGPGDNEDPTWSPDGRYLAFSSTREGGAAIYVINVNGTHQRKLTAFRGESTNPAWSPHGE